MAMIVRFFYFFRVLDDHENFIGVLLNILSRVKVVDEKFSELIFRGVIS